MIIECSNRFFRVNGHDVPMLIVECDQCSTKAKKGGKDHGEAAEKARSEGFITIQGAMVGSPRSWLCPGCAKPNGDVLPLAAQ